MTLGDVLTVGPLNLPVRYLVLIGAVAVGYAVMSIALVRRPALRRATANRFLNALITFLIVWKLEPVIASFVNSLEGGSIDFGGAALSIFIPGGRVGTIAGAAGSLVYLVISLARDRKRVIEGSQSPEESLPRPRRAITKVLSLALVVAPGALVLFGTQALLAPRGPVGGPTQSVTSTAGASHQATAPAVPGRIGSRAPTFTAETLSGSHLRLGEPSDQIFVLNFWATWCPPCRAELPELVRFVSTHRSGSVTVWGVDMTSSERSIQAVRTFAASHRINFPILLDPTGEIARAYGVHALPSTFVLDSRGRIVAAHVGAMSPSWLSTQLTSRAGYPLKRPVGGARSPLRESTPLGLP